MAQLIFTNGSAPATPPSGTVAIFSETDKNMYQIDDTGTVTQLGGGGSGTVSSVSVVSANGLAGTVATATTTPAITLTTTVNSPVLAGNGTAISGATTTGSGSTVVLATSPTLITPALGTPTALVGTNITGTATAFTASNVTTNANLTGPITSVGNATSVASQTGTGSTFVMQASPILTTPNIGAATGTSLSVSGQLTSTVSTGTAPLVVSSTTQVANLNAATAGSATTATNATNVATTTKSDNTTYYPAFVGANSSSNQGIDVGSMTYNPSTNTLTATQFAGNASTVTTNANLTGDVTSVGNATSLVATSNSTLTTLSALSLPYSQVTGGPSTNAITALTGDGTASGPGSALFTLATVNTNTGSFGSSTSIPSFTVNGKGLITAASGNVVIAPAGTLSGTTLNSSVVTSSLTTVGTIGTGTWQGTTIAVNHGGTGQTSLSNFTDSTSGADGITVTGGVGSVIASTSIAQQVANTTQNGYLSSTDWNTFNGKQSTVSFTSVGSSPNANGGSISSGVITLEPADGTHPGLISTTTQTFAGNKTFLGNVTVDGIESVSGQFLADNGTVLLPGMAFTNDPDCGLYIAGSEELGIAVAGVQAMDFKKSSGGFGNIGMGGGASTSDSYPLLIQRDVASAGVYAQISNTDTAAYSKATWQLAADAGNNNGEISLFTSATPLAAYANAMIVRPSGNTGQLALIGGDLSTGYVSTFTGGDYTGTGETVRFNADHTNQFMQSVTTPASPAAGLKYYNNAGVFSSKTTGGTVSSFSGSNTGDQTITLTGGVTGSGTGSFAATVVTNANLTGPVTSVGNATSVTANAITNAMLAQMNDQTIKGNVSGGSASPSDLTAAQVARMIQAYIGANITYGIYY